MDEHLLILLEPAIQGIPGDRDIPVKVGISKPRAWDAEGAAGPETIATSSRGNA
jgi:hypothetical protein